MVSLLNTENATAFRDLKLRALKEDPFAFSDSYEDYVARDPKRVLDEIRSAGDPPETFCLGFFDEDRLAGFLRFARDTRFKARHKASIHDMYVVPELRGSGVGRRLVEHALERARCMAGLEHVYLWVLNSPAYSARGFYEALGFRSMGVAEQDLIVRGDYVDAEYMTLFL